MKNHTFSENSIVFLFFYLLCAIPLFSQENDTILSAVNISGSASTSDSYVNRFSNSSGEEILVETEFEMFNRGDATYLSRFELKEGRFISFKILNSASVQNARLKISYTQAGMERADFIDLNDIAIEIGRDWQSFEFQPEIDTRAKTFLKWELVTSQSPENRGIDEMSEYQKSFLAHEELPFAQISKLTKGGNHNFTLQIEGESHQIYLEEVNLLSEDFRVTLFDGRNKTEVKVENQAKTYAGINIKTGGNVRLTVAENFVSGFIEAGEEIFYIIPEIICFFLGKSTFFY